MEKRKNYEAPAMEVMELKLQDSLLTGSSMEGTGTFGEGAKLNDFDEGWD